MPALDFQLTYFALEKILLQVKRNGAVCNFEVSKTVA